MYTANKIETFRPAHGRGYEPSRTLLIFCLLTTVLLCLTAASNTASATTYYLDAVNGDDSNPGTSAEPWKTIGKVIAEFRDSTPGTLTYGDHVKFRNGSYGTFSLTQDTDWEHWTGSMTNEVLPANTEYLYIEADTGHTPVFSRIELGDDVANTYYKAAIVFDGIKIEIPGAAAGVHIEHSIGPKFRNMHIEGTSYIDGSPNAFQLKRTAHSGNYHNNDIEIDNCTIHHVGTGFRAWSSNLYIHDCNLYDIGNDNIKIVGGDSGAWNVVIEDNLIHHTNTPVFRDGCWQHPEGWHPDGIQLDGAIDGVYIRGNKFYDLSSQGISPDFVQYNVVVENNLFYKIHSTEFRLGAVNVTFRNNTIIPKQCGGMESVTFEYSSNNRVYNNIIISNYGGIPSKTPYHDFNIYVKSSSLGDSELNSYGYASMAAAEADFPNLFVDPDNDDYRLKPGSLAIDFGDPNYVAEPNETDLDGNPRVSNGRIDAGCYEYMSQSLVADAGPDQTVTDSDGNGSEQVTLDGSGSSDPDGTIESYAWSEGGNQIATGDSPAVTLSVGAHTITLTVTDNDGLTDTDTVAITVEGPDVTAPSIVSVSASETSVEITFSESLDPTLAEQTSNYSINNGISVIAASLDTDTVTLTTSAHAEGSYTLTVTNVQDTSGNPMTQTTRNYEYDYGLVGHWKFDDGSGGSAVDSSVNGNTGMLINGPTWTTGNINGGLSFDGADDAVEIGTTGLNSGAGTVALWSYAVSFASTGQYLFGHASQPWANRIQLYTDDTSGNLDLGLGNSHTTHTNIQDLNTNIWYHITLTWDGTNYVVFIDGTSTATGSYAGLSTLETYADIGNVGYSSDRSEAFSGIIDEVRIYNRALTAGEILDLYNAGTSNPVTHTLGVTAVNGSVTKTPDKASYNHSEEVTLQAEPDTGYSFVNWSGDLTGSSNPATIIMDANKSVTANFTITINTYMLNITALNGSVTKTPDQASYNQGEEVTLQATAGTGYNFVDWSGDLSGSTNPDTITMDTDKSVTANFAIKTYTLTYNAGANGSITGPTPQTVDHGSDGTAVTAVPDLNYHFVDWSDASTDNPRTDTNVTATINVTANFSEQDVTDPTVTNLSPDPNGLLSDLVPLNSLILLDITDSGDGVDANTVEIKVNDDLIYDGDNETSAGVYDSTGKPQTVKGVCRRIGNIAAYKYIFQPNEKCDFDQTLTVTVNASDLAATANVMNPFSYSLITEQHSFGENKILHSGSNNENWGPLTTVCDGSGNIWIAWPQGVVGSRDIYVGKLVAGTDSFVNSGVVQVTNDSNDQGNPVLAVDGADKLYLAWQDNRRGNWDIYVSTSSDGINWSTETRVTDSNDNQINPAIAVDSTDKVYVVWEDDQNSDKDIYIASSTNSFSTQVTTRITSSIYDQITPDIAVDSDDTVYVVWTDTRNSKNDIYGAASNNGPWTNIAIVTAEESQSNPAIATESEGSILHLVWVDDRPGDDDIYYATSDGLPASPLTDSNSIIDDTTDADQISPVIITTGYTGNDLKVFACWRDERFAEAELYAVETTANGTNIYVGNDFTTDDQSQPAIGIDQYGYPYLVWINGRTDICYAGSTFIEPTALASVTAPVSTTTTVGTVPGSITNIDDVSAEFPQGAYLCDIKVTISRIRNPHKPPSNNRTFLYEFGPSGTTFSEPVTITIPYNATTLVSSPSAYWYNPLTGLYSQEGITDVEVIQISGLYALRFKTTHFSMFGGGGPFGGGGGGGGGGCSMSPDSQASAVELLLPYMGLTVAMVVLKLRDRRKRKARNITKSEC